MKIQIVENMDGSASVNIDGAMYNGACNVSESRVDGVRRAMTIEAVPVEDEVSEEAGPEVEIAQP